MIPAASVRRPITVLMGVLAVTVFGALALQRLPVELLPDLSYPTLTVQTRYADAAPVSVEQFISRPVEEAVGVIPGVRALRSVSRAGLSEVVLEFEWDEDMDLAAMEVREKLGLVRLPREAEPPRVLRFDPARDPVVRVALAGPRSLDALHDLAERWLEPRLEAVRGVAAVKVLGGLEAEVRVDADAERLAALGLTLADLSQALAAENVNLPGGTLEDYGAVYLIRTLHEFETLAAIRRTVVREAPDGRVRVEDVAEVQRGAKDPTAAILLNGADVVELALHREGSANTMAVAAAARAELEALRAELPAGLSLRLLSDQSRYVGAAVQEVWSAALLGGLLAIAVVYFFLHDLLATLTIAISIPVSVVATFLPMQQAGVFLNVMSLGGLALGVGMLVDNSIVVLEAIDRHRREGLGRAEAAARGAGEVAGAVSAATLTTISVFLPIVFVSGVAGQLFYDLAVTVCLALLASLAVSLTLIPALSALSPFAGDAPPTLGLFRWGGERAQDPPGSLRLGPLLLLPLGDGRGALSHIATAAVLPVRLPLALLLLLALGGAFLLGRLFHLFSWPAARLLDLVQRAYPPLLSGALRGRWLLLPLGVAAFAASLTWVERLGTRLIPDLAQGEFAFRLRLPEGTPLAATRDLVQRITGPLAGDPRFARVFAVAGVLPSSASGRQSEGENLARLDLVLPAGADARAEAAARARVRELLAAYPRVEAEQVQAQAIALSPPLVVEVYADDLQVLEEAAGRVAERLAQLPQLHDIASTVEPGNPEVRVALDRERAAALGLSSEQVARALRRQVRGEVVGRFREAERRIDIRLRAAKRYRDRAEAVRDLRVRLPEGRLLPVSAVAEVVVERGPAALHHSGGARVARVSARTRARDLGRAIAELRATLAELELPAGAVVELAGQDRELSESVASLRLALALAVFLVFVVMAVQFESLRHPFVILLSVPLGLIGVVGALWLTRTAVGVLVLIGVVMLAGIVVNNAIVLVDAINRRRRAGEAFQAAIRAGARERLRPILMTTTTTVLALLPMAVGWGAGNELRAPLAVTVIGGLSCATVLTLGIIPCVYFVLGGGSAGERAA